MRPVSARAAAAMRRRVMPPGCPGPRRVRASGRQSFGKDRRARAGIARRARSGCTSGPHPAPSIRAVGALLLVEDDVAIAEPLKRALEREGHEVEWVTDGPAAAQRGSAGEHDLVILDLGLPGLDGLEVCRRIRQSAPDLPVMMLTARGEELDAVVGLDAGADDYVAKPFRAGELLARVRARLRRAAGPEVLVAGEVRVDPASRRASVDGRELDLTPKEFDLLALLVREAGV